MYTEIVAGLGKREKYYMELLESAQYCAKQNDLKTDKRIQDETVIGNRKVYL